MAYFDMYYNLAENLNDTADDNLTRCKQWINYTLRDLANMYQFEELIESITTTASSYDFKRLKNIKTASTLHLISDATAEATTAQVYGYYLNSTTRTYYCENIVLTGTATANSTYSYNVIDRIELISACAGNITIANGTQDIGTLLPGETKIANDYSRVVKVDNQNGDVTPIADRDRLLKYPGNTNFDAMYYTLRGSDIYFYGVTSEVTIYKYCKHPWLINDYDTSPLFIEESDIVEAASLGWGLRFEDEADGTTGKQLYKAKLAEIIGNKCKTTDQVIKIKQSRKR